MSKQLNEFAPDEPNMGSDMGADEPMQTMPHGEVDHEGAMAKADLFKLANYSLKLFKQMQDNDQLEAWVQAKITKAADYIASVYHYLEYEMKFSEYGSKLENSEMYNESEKAELRNKLNEAREMIRAMKLQQADRIDEGKKAKKDYDGDGKVESGKDEYLGSKIRAAKKAGKIEEGLGGDMQPCEACGGTGHVETPVKEWSQEAKDKAAVYNRKAKAFHAAAKRIDANKNGIPDDEETGTEPKDKAPAKKAAPKKPAADKPAAEDKPAKKSASDGVGEGVYEGKPSAGMTKKEKSSTVKAAKAGKDIGKPGKSFDKVAKAAGGGEKGTKIAAAAMWKNKAKSVEESANKSDIPAAQRKAKGGDWKVTTKDLKDEETKGKISHKDNLAKNDAKAVNESADLTRMKTLMTRLNG